MKLNNPDSPELPREMKQHITRHQAPPGLGRRIRFMLDQQVVTPRVSILPRAIAGWPRHWFGQWGSLGISLVCGALLAVGIVRIQLNENAAQQFRQLSGVLLP